MDGGALGKAQVQGNRMAPHHRHTNAGAAHLHLRQVENFPAFVLELHLLGGVAGLLLAADLRDQIEGDLMGKHLGLDRLALHHGVHLLAQLHRPGRARAGDRLVGGGHHGDDGRKLPQGVDRRDSDDRGAVGIGNDAAMLLHVLGVDLRNHQRHVLPKPEGGGIINKHGSGLHDGGRELPGDVVFRRAKHDVQPLKGIRRGQLDLDGLAVPGHDLARAALAREQMQLADREIPFQQNFHHLPAHGTGSAENTDFILLHYNIPPK